MPCFIQQALRAGRIFTKDESKIKKLLDELGCMIKDIPMDHTPPETGLKIYSKIREITKTADPYREIKDANIKKAKRLYPRLKEKVKNAEDKLLTAIRLAVAGNVIDLAIAKPVNLDNEIKTILKQDFAIFDYEEFKKKLNNAEKILYLGDNAGEAVFDKILIEQLQKPVTYVVRDIPIINDATFDDAVKAGIATVAEIISSGSKAPGTILKICNDNFVQKFENADMIISKGQGNYEGLSNKKNPYFFY